MRAELRLLGRADLASRRFRSTLASPAAAVPTPRLAEMPEREGFRCWWAVLGGLSEVRLDEKEAAADEGRVGVSSTAPAPG